MRNTAPRGPFRALSAAHDARSVPPGMKEVRFSVPHSLGRDEALRRIRQAAEELAAGRSVVRRLEWSETGALVAGDGFEGRLIVLEAVVEAEVQLGWQLAFFPLKAQREAEAWLAGVLR
jgi:hypothetical protein